MMRLNLSGYLLTGMYRADQQFLDAIEYYQCCRPCNEHGDVMTVTNCRTGDWGRSFDYAGWSFCPDQSFVSGFYKSSCNWIYCLEYGKFGKKEK